MDADSLQNLLDGAKFQLRCKEGERSKFAEKNKELEEVLRKQKEEIKTLEKSKLKAKEQADGYRNQARVLQEDRFRYEEVRREAEELKHKLENYKSVELSIRGQEGELNKFLHERGAFDNKTRDLATLVVMMKQKMADVKKERSMAENRLKEASREQAMERRKGKELEVQVAEMQSINRSLEGEVWKYKEDMKSLEEKLECLERGDQFQIITPSSSPLLAASPPPPSFSSQPPKLPTFKLASSTKRAHSPDPASTPCLPLLSHSSKRLAGCTASQAQPATSLTKHYDGLGGRARLDMFPQPRVARSSSSQVARSKQTKTGGMGGKQARTIDKFFGSFDTP